MTFSDFALAAWACGDVIVDALETFAFGGAVKGLGSQASMRLPRSAIVFCFRFGWVEVVGGSGGVVGSGGWEGRCGVLDSGEVGFPKRGDIEGVTVYGEAVYICS